LAYRLGILSIVKEMIHKGSSEYYDLLFIHNKRELKPFAHATYIKNMKINKNEIEGDKLILTISSPSFEFIMHLMNGSQRKAIYEYKQYKFELVNKQLLPKPPQFNESMVFKTKSPILIESKSGQPLLSNHPDFDSEFNYYANLIANNIYNRDLYQPIKIIQSSMKKMVIKEHLHQKMDKYIYLTVNQGFVHLNGNPEDLQMIYECGVGLRRSLGLGLLEIEEVTI